jgi:hypothetical protein
MALKMPSATSSPSREQLSGLQGHSTRFPRPPRFLSFLSPTKRSDIYVANVPWQHRSDCSKVTFTTDLVAVGFRGIETLPRAHIYLAPFSMVLVDAVHFSSDTSIVVGRGSC